MLSPCSYEFLSGSPVSSLLLKKTSVGGLAVQQFPEMCVCVCSGIHSDPKQDKVVTEYK